MWNHLIKFELHPAAIRSYVFVVSSGFIYDASKFFHEFIFRFVLQILYEDSNEDMHKVTLIVIV